MIPRLPLLVATLALSGFAASASPPSDAARPPAPLVLPELLPHLICAYDFEHPAPDDPAHELDLGSSGARLRLVNGGPAMRSPDGARPGSRASLQTRQLHPETAGDDDWKAGAYDPAGIPALSPFASARGITLLGWVKSTAPSIRPALNSTTPAPDDRYPGIGLFGLLHGASDGHTVRALVEFIPVSGELRLVTVGRRLDDGAGMVLAAAAPPDELLPPDTWVHLVATFDFELGSCRLYRDGRPLATLPPSPGDPWALAATPGPHRASATNPTGIKIGGSHPQNTRERNPFDGRFDDLFFFDRVLTPDEVRRQHALSLGVSSLVRLSESPPLSPPGKTAP